MPKPQNGWKPIDLLKYKAVCTTAKATPGMLLKYIYIYEYI